MNMKKFSLKPLGDACIQKLCKSWFFIGLIMAFCVSACSDDDDNVVTPKFPEKQNIVCNSGSTTEFTFEANTNWSLTSSAIWCKFEKDGMDEFILSGEAGKQTITIIVTDDDKKVGSESVAKLELTMGGQTIVIGEVTRPVEDYELKIYDEAGNEIQELEVGYDKYTPFKVKANFRFAATNLPSWVALEGDALVGPVNKEVKGGLKIIQDGNIEKYPIAASDDNVITFADETGKGFRSFKVIYKGMTPGAIEVTVPATNRYGWTVSLDGKSFAQDGNTNTYTNRLPFTIKTLNDDYEIVFIEKGMYNNSLYLMDPEYDEWMRCEGEKGNIGLIVSPLDLSTGIKERVGYVLALSRAEYESIKDDLEGTLIDGEDITYKYQQSALLAQFTQKEIKKQETDGLTFTAVDGQTYNPLECTSYSEGDASYFKDKYDVKSIFEIKQPGLASTVLKASSNLDFGSLQCYYLDNEADANGVTEPYDLNQITIYTEATDGRDIFIITADESGNKAMIIVRTSYTGGGDGEQKFIVINGSAPVEYSGSNAQALISMHNLLGLYETKGESIDIKMTPSAIKEFKVYDLTDGDGSTDITDTLGEDCQWGYNDMGMTEIGKINAYFGEWSNIADKTLLIVVTCEDNSIYGIVASKGN